MEITIQYLQAVAEMISKHIKADNDFPDDNWIDIMADKKGYVSVSIKTKEKLITSTKYNDKEGYTDYELY